MPARYKVEARRDAEARVCWATCAGLPGFVTEAPTYDALVVRALDLISELVDAHEGAEVEFAMPVPRTERLPAVA